MHLRCRICGDIQPVTVADEADEDRRTQGIRQAFRAEHLLRCGDGTVSLCVQAPSVAVVDPQLWSAYLEAIKPPNVTVGADGFFTRAILRDGVMHRVRVCEACWENIPRYVDFPQGLVSPESDGALGCVAKQRIATVDTEDASRAAAVEHLGKAVCLPCYLKAFRRFYQTEMIPSLSEDVIGDGLPVEVAEPVESGRSTVFQPKA